MCGFHFWRGSLLLVKWLLLSGRCFRKMISSTENRIRITRKTWSAVIIDDTCAVKRAFTDNQEVWSEFKTVKNLCVTLVLWSPQYPVPVSVRLRGCYLEALVDRHILRAYRLMNYSQRSDSRSWKKIKVRYLDGFYCRLKEKVWWSALTTAMKKRSFTCLFNLGDKTSDVLCISAVLWSCSWCCKYKYLKEVKIYTTLVESQV